MDNVVCLPSRKVCARHCPPASSKDALAEARELLSGTVESIEDADGNTNTCHLAAVEKAKALLSQVACSNAEDDGDRAMKSLSLVELARFALVLGPEPFDGDDLLTYGLTIAEALNAARDRLGAEEVASG